MKLSLCHDMNLVELTSVFRFCALNRVYPTPIRLNKYFRDNSEFHKQSTHFCNAVTIDFAKATQ